MLRHEIWFQSTDLTALGELSRHDPTGTLLGAYCGRAAILVGQQKKPIQRADSKRLYAALRLLTHLNAESQLEIAGALSSIAQIRKSFECLGWAWGDGWVERNTLVQVVNEILVAEPDIDTTDFFANHLGSYLRETGVPAALADDLRFNRGKTKRFPNRIGKGVES